MQFDLKHIKVEARDLPDLWFQAIYQLLEHGRRFTINEGSYAGQTRLEFDYFTGHIKNPGNLPLLPDIPEHLGIPNPVEEAYVFGGEGYERSYIEYLMTGELKPNESYTYGERLAKASIYSRILFDVMKCNKEIIYPHAFDDKILFMEPDGQVFVNQIEWIIEKYKTSGHRNNQLVLQIAQPQDIVLVDPPCLRSIDTRIQDGKLHFFVYFRSWDLWGGLPANLAGIQTLKEYMASEIGVKDGEMIVESKGLHLYGYVEELAKIRCMVE